jgi:hypothetical protein
MFLVVMCSPCSAGVEVVERAFVRGDWQVQVWRGVWDDKLRMEAMATPSNVIGGRGQAVLGAMCGRTAPIVFFQWPEPVPANDKRAVEVIARFDGSAHERIILESLNFDYSARRAPSNDVLAWFQSEAVSKLRSSQRLVIGTSFRFENAAIFSLRGAAEALDVLAAFCRDGSIPAR